MALLKPLLLPAGLLLQQDRKDMGHMNSAVLLLGRLLMATLFVFVGYTQVRIMWSYKAGCKGTESDERAC